MEGREYSEDFRRFDRFTPKEFYAEMVTIAEACGYSKAFPIVQFRKRFGRWPEKDEKNES